MNNRTLTEFKVLILVPLVHLEVKKLKPVEMRSMSNKASCRIGASKNSLTSCEVFKAESLEKKRMVRKLTKAIMCMTVKSINSNL